MRIDEVVGSTGRNPGVLVDDYYCSQIPDHCLLRGIG